MDRYSISNTQPDGRSALLIFEFLDDAPATIRTTLTRPHPSPPRELAFLSAASFLARTVATPKPARGDGVVGMCHGFSIGSSQHLSRQPALIGDISRTRLAAVASGNQRKQARQPILVTLSVCFLKRRFAPASFLSPPVPESRSGLVFLSLPFRLADATWLCRDAAGHSHVGRLRTTCCCTRTREPAGRSVRVPGADRRLAGAFQRPGATDSGGGLPSVGTRERWHVCGRGVCFRAKEELSSCILYIT